MKQAEHSGLRDGHIQAEFCGKQSFSTKSSSQPGSQTGNVNRVFKIQCYFRGVLQTHTGGLAELIHQANVTAKSHLVVIYFHFTVSLAWYRIVHRHRIGKIAIHHV